MPARDSQDRPRFGQPASFRFWVVASSAVAGIAILGLVLPMGGGASVEDDDGPRVVINLHDPPSAPATPHDTHSAANPAEPPQAVDMTSALVATDGTVVIEPALLAPSSDGPVPVVAPDGRKSMHVYAARFDPADPRPRAAIILTGLGLSDQVTQLAIDRLPPGSTLSFSPYGQNLQNWIAAARARGHETLLELPMEPFNFPDDDPGPQTLMAGGDNQAKLTWLLSRFSGYAGVVNAQGGKLLASPADLRPILSQVAQRGLFMAEVGLSQRSLAPTVAKETQTPYARATIQIDKVPGPDEVDAALEALSSAALERRAAIGTASAAPGVIDRIAAWAAKLEDRGIAYAPVSAALPLASAAAP
jgi:uncharacterized protein